MTSAWTICAAGLLLAVPIGAGVASPAKPAPGPKPAAKAKPAPKVRITPLACAVPVGRADSARALQRRFGDNALPSSRSDEQGVQVFKLVLYPYEPARRIEVIYPDAAMRVPLRLSIDRLSSTWSVAGLRVGQDLAAVTARNGGPFALRGFGPGEGGRVIDWKGGALGAALPGGCTVGVRLVAPLPEQVAAGASGAGRIVGSEQGEVVAAEPLVAELSISWPAPAAPVRKRK